MFKWPSLIKGAFNELTGWLIAFIVLAFVLAASFPPRFGTGMVETPDIKSLSNAKWMGIACKEYAMDHDGKFPPSLDALVPAYKSNAWSLNSPLRPDDPAGYNYTPGLKDEPPYDAVMIEDRFAPSFEHERILVYANGLACILRLPADMMSTIAEALKNAKTLGLACRQYADDHDGNYPPNLEILVPHYLPSRLRLVSPFMPSEPMGYYYRSKLRTDTSPSDCVLIADRFASLGHCGIIIYVDGTAQVVDSWPAPPCVPIPLENQRPAPPLCYSGYDFVCKWLRLARSGAPIYQTKAYVGHASDTVHAIYQRLAPVDVRHLGAALSNPSAGTKGSP